MSSGVAQIVVKEVGSQHNRIGEIGSEYASAVESELRVSQLKSTLNQKRKALRIKRSRHGAKLKVVLPAGKRTSPVNIKGGKKRKPFKMSFHFLNA